MSPKHDSTKDSSEIRENIEHDVMYKVLLLGDSGVGKTSLIRSLCPTNNFRTTSLLPTVGIDFVKATFNIDGVKVCLQIWDTAGQERFRSITKFHYRGTKGLLLVYDITCRQTFDMLIYWLQSIEKDFDQNGKESIPLILVGNKSDLEDIRSVSTSEGRKLADRNVAAGFWETSAQNNVNVSECFYQLAHTLTDLYDPDLMDMYRYSATIDLINDRVNFQASSPIATELACSQTAEIKRTSQIKQHPKEEVMPKTSNHLSKDKSRKNSIIKLSRKQPNSSCSCFRQ